MSGPSGFEGFGITEEPVEVPNAETVDEGDPTGTRFYRLRELMDRPELLRPPECVIPRLAYRGRLTILAGPDKSGKSTVAAHAAAAHTRDRHFLEEPTRGRRKRVVWVGLEEHTGDAVRRFIQLGADPDRLDIVGPASPDLLAALGDLLAAEPADFVLVDSLTEFARVTCGQVPDDGDNAGWASVIRPLGALARSQDCAVLVLHHVRKSDGRYRGATEIAAAVDALFELEMPGTGEEPELRRISGRGRWEIHPFAIVLREDGYHLAGGTELTLDSRILLYVKANPGCSLRAVSQNVRGKAQTVRQKLKDLIDAELITDLGTESASELHLAGEQRDAWETAA